MQTKINPTTQTATAQPDAPAPGGSPARAFVRHYAEMLVAMFLGMFVLGFALSALLALAGVEVSSWDTDAPALLLLGMATVMTIPMVGWMRHRGHRWLLCWEMAASMFVPTFVAVGLLWAAVETDVHALMGIQHVAMFPSMLAAMLLRRREYVC